MIRWTLDRVARAIGAGVPDAWDAIAGVSVDSRTIAPGQAYVALRGERFDGHAFAAEAVRRGAAAVIAEEPVDATVPVLMVPGTLAALGELARAYRACLRGAVIAVTGSCGKTTTCRMIHSACGSLRGTCSKKSHNNHIGVPLTILASAEDDDYLICELGTSAPGEIAALTALVRPDLAVITNAGRAHLEGLGDVDGVRREKAAIGSTGAPVLIPAGDEALRAALDNADAAETFSAEDITTGVPGGVAFRAGGLDARVPLSGDHHAMNAAAAVAVAQHLGVPGGAIVRGLAGVTPPPMRYERTEAGGVSVINDAYNANPESTEAAVRTFLTPPRGPGRRVVVLGDMLELGRHARAAHEAVVTQTLALRPDVLIAVGPATGAALPETATVPMHRFDALDDTALEHIAGLIEPGDEVLLKGSRGMGLERVAEALGRAGARA